MKNEPIYMNNSEPKIGIVLCNLGTPDEPTAKAIRRYLKEFLWDKRVVEIPRAIWWFILNFIILPFRPRKTARAYRLIWDRKNNDSPLRVITKQQASALQETLDKTAPNTYQVEIGMRYGKPSIKGAVSKLKAERCDKILLLPLYPHYAAATVGSACDAFFDALKEWRWMPTARVATPYFDHKDYIKALKDSINEHIETLNFKPDMILASYHGIPDYAHTKGDPYPNHCYKTTHLLTEELKVPTGYITTTFQSRFGNAKWVEPYTDQTLNELPQRGVRNLVVITPAFHSDCLETLEEMAIAGRKTFMVSGGKNYSIVPCLNASKSSIHLLASLVNDNTSDWLKTKKNPNIKLVKNKKVASIS